MKTVNSFFKLIFLLVVCAPQSYALNCKGLLQVFERPELSDSVKATLEPIQTREEITQTFKSLLLELKAFKLNDAIAAQTVMSSKKSLEEFLEYHESFPETGFSVTSKEHALLVQTAYLSGISGVRILQLFADVPSDIIRFQNNVARIMILQTTLFSGRNQNEVIDFYTSPGKTAYSVKSFANLSIIQMAFFANKTVKEVNVLYRLFPYISGVQGQVGGDALRRLALFAE